jgi:hypothetical protein
MGDEPVVRRSLKTERVLHLPIFRRIRHPGNYAYLFGLNHSTAGRLAKLHDGGLPYPRRQHRCGEHPDLLLAA